MSDAADWYKDAIIYELRVRSFYDSNGDGIGDLAGLIEKLDYLKDLGVTAIWLLPTYPSPLRDDGYDISDYSTVHRSVGTLDDFRRMLDAAHARDLKVITELVLNHTSDAHPWFQRARRSPPGSRYRNFYVWSDDPQKWSDARIIFQDFETSNWTWDPVANAYYWHRFFSHQPDLNFESEEVQETMLGVVDYWFQMGVDGLRLDAVPYLYERERTTCENLPETHAFLKKLRAHIDSKFTGRMLLAEANQWPEDAAAYFGDGDECHMAFHFPIMPRLFMALRMEDSYAIADILEQTPAIPESCQWAVFLRNHDELTLEMVTDEERDYMVQRYASDRQTRINLGIRRRLAPLMENDRRSIELMNVLLLSMPGTPVIYYGDEIGMGDNAYLGDRNGVRTPMQWSPDRNGGFSRANPQQLILPTIIDPEYSYETVNVEVQQANPRSLLWWMRRALALRKRYPAFARGSLTLLAPENRKVLAFLRRYAGEALLVVVNLSRAPQWVELELGEFKGVRPVELFGNVEFPPVTDPRYLLTLGGHGVFWFSLSQNEVDASGAERSSSFLPAIVTATDPSTAFRPGSALERELSRYVPGRRWFRSKTRKVTGARIADSVPLPAPANGVELVFVELRFDEGDPELYVLPIALTESEEPPAFALVGIRSTPEEQPRMWLSDASQDGRVGRALHALSAREERLRGRTLELCGVRSEEHVESDAASHSARAIAGEQSNTSYVLGQEYVGKLVRKLEEGRSLEVDVLEHLARAPSPPNVPRIVSRVAIESGANVESTLWISQSYVQNQGDAWELTIDSVQRFYERVLTVHRERTPLLPVKSLLDAAFEPVPAEVEELFAEHLPLLRILGTRTAELHVALAHDRAHPRFAPRRYTALTRRSFYQSLRNSSARAFDKLRKAHLSPSVAELADAVRKQRDQIRERLDRVRSTELGGFVIRVHGDYHLGQVLYTGRDFYVIDFEGEPSRARAERERLRSPMADVAGMLRSFHYAALGVLFGELSGSRVREEDRPALSPWAAFHQRWSSVAFLSTYLPLVMGAELLPNTRPELALLLEVHLLEKALYELSYELDSRPHWVELPLRGLLDVLEG